MWTDRNRGEFFPKIMYTGQDFPVNVPDLYTELIIGKRMQIKPTQFLSVKEKVERQYHCK